MAHRFAYEEQFGNMRRRAELVTTCPAGHPYDGENLRLYQGRKYCRTCVNSFRARRRQALKHVHPDTGADGSDPFLRLQEAMKVLDENDG